MGSGEEVPDGRRQNEWIGAGKSMQCKLTDSVISGQTTIDAVKFECELQGAVQLMTNTMSGPVNVVEG